MKRIDDRDDAVERLLRQTAPGSSADAGDGCLDAETMAAWLDGGLPGAGRAQAEAHVADCPRCQAIVAVMARAEPASVPAMAPAAVSRRWLGWLVPLTAAAAALLVWIALPRPPSAPPAQQTTARAELSDASKVDAARADSSRDRPSAPTAPAVVTPASGGQNARRIQQGPEADVRERRERAETLNKTAMDRVLPPSPSAASQERDASAAPPPAAASGSARAAFSDQAPTSRPLAPGVASPDGRVFWRFAGPLIERSTDGQSWQAVFTDSGVDLLSGASTSASICWIVGRRGVVLRTIDGRTFTRVAFPERVDLIVVRANDAEQATVTTIDGRVLGTTDGGTTWR